MPLSSATITFDIADMLGVDYDTRRGIRAWVDTNIPGDAVVDTDGNRIRLGSGKITVASDGTGTASVWIPGTGSNPASWQTYFHFEYVDTGDHKKGRTTRTFGPFTVTASGDLADLIEEQEVPPTYLSVVTDLLDGFVAEAETAATTAAASATSAAASASAASTISGLDTVEDALDVALAGTPNMPAGFTSQPDYLVANTIIVKPSTNTDPGIIEWAHDSPSGYLLHLVSRPNMGDAAALIGMGIDYDGVGLLLANKLNGTGLHVHNHATATSQAVGISGLQMSTAAPLLSFSQGAAGAKELIKLFADATRTAGQQMQVWQNSAMTLGYVEAGGLFRWQHSAYFKQGATSSPALRVEGVTGSTVNAFDVLLPAGGGTPFAVSQTGVVTTMHGTKLRNDNALTENPLRVTNMSTTANVDTLRIVGVSGQLGDQLSIRDSSSVVQSRFNKAGYFITAKSSAPADADLNSFELALWVDATPGSTKLMIKAKDSGGTVRTGQVALA